MNIEAFDSNFEKLNTIEKAVLGCALMSTERAHYIFGNLKIKDFYIDLHREMFSEMLEKWKKHGVIDVPIMSTSKYKMDFVTVFETVPAPSRYKRYVAELKDIVGKLRAAGVGEKLINYDYDEIGKAIEDLSNLQSGTEDTQKDFNMVQLAVDFTQRMHDGKPDFFKFGLGMDRALRLKAGNMLVVGARPSVGKTAFSLQIAINLAIKGKHVVFFSLETDKATIFDRMFANISSVKSEDVQECRIDWDDDRMMAELDWMAKLPITIVEAAGKSVSWIGSEAMRLKADAIIVDYLGIVKSSAKTRYEKATEISIDFHTFAQRNKILTILLSQLNRTGAGMPLIECLRESGQIEQDADAIILLDTDAEERNKSEDVILTAVLAKNKNGYTGKKQLFFERKTQRITEIEEMK